MFFLIAANEGTVYAMRVSVLCWLTPTGSHFCRAKEDQRRWARIEGLGTNDLAHKRLGKDRGPARTRNVPVGSWGSYSNGRPNKGGRMG